MSPMNGGGVSDTPNAEKFIDPEKKDADSDADDDADDDANNYSDNYADNDADADDDYNNYADNNDESDVIDQLCNYVCRDLNPFYFPYFHPPLPVSSTTP